MNRLYIVNTRTFKETPIRDGSVLNIREFCPTEPSRKSVRLL
jgi:hypothetical protein